MTNIETTEQMPVWRLVERAWDDMWLPAPPHPPDHAFIIDECYLGAMLHEPELKLTLTRPQALAALEYWRAKMIEGVEKVAAEYRAQFETSARFSEAPKGGAL